MSDQPTAHIRVRVHPGSGHSRLQRFEQGIWHIRIAAPPVEGKANSELERYLAGLLGVPKDWVTIGHGHTGRNKLVKVTGLTAGQVESQLGLSLRKSAGDSL